jgi:phosphate uptake regulator
MTASKQHLDAVFDNVNHMQHIAERLDRLSSAFHMTGNVKVAHELDSICDEIVAAAERVRATFGEAQDEELANHQANMGNILSILLKPDTGEK